jgi:hypothetical protein
MTMTPEFRSVCPYCKIPLPNPATELEFVECSQCKRAIAMQILRSEAAGGSNLNSQTLAVAPESLQGASSTEPVAAITEPINSETSPQISGTNSANSETTSADSGGIAHCLLPPKFLAADPEFVANSIGGESDWTVLLPDGEGGVIPVDDRVVRIMHRGKVIELWRLPEETRRFRQSISNVVFVLIGLIFLLLLFWLMA